MIKTDQYFIMPFKKTLLFKIIVPILILLISCYYIFSNNYNVLYSLCEKSPFIWKHYHIKLFYLTEKKNGDAFVKLAASYKNNHPVGQLALQIASRKESSFYPYLKYVLLNPQLYSSDDRGIVISVIYTSNIEMIYSSIQAVASDSADPLYNFAQYACEKLLLSYQGEMGHVPKDKITVEEEVGKQSETSLPNDNQK